MAKVAAAPERFEAKPPWASPHPMSASMNAITDTITATARRPGRWKVGTSANNCGRERMNGA